MPSDQPTVTLLLAVHVICWLYAKRPRVLSGIDPDICGYRVAAAIQD
jgi:hypothetical protein